MIYVTNVDVFAHTLEEEEGSGALSHIKPGATTRFIFTGVHWSCHQTDVSLPNAGRRRLKMSMIDSEDVESSVVSLEHTLNMKNRTNFKTIDENTNKVFLNDFTGTKIELPLATGSGRVIRFTIQQSLVSGSVYSIGGKNDD